jgi:type I restriction enzyme M protein
MNKHSRLIVQKLWNYCNVLRDDGLSYSDYVEQLTYLLFLKMADERDRATNTGIPILPDGYDWKSLLGRDGATIESHYRKILEKLGKQPGTLGVIFRKAQNKIQNPAKLRRLIVDLIDREQWSNGSADVKGDAYEGLLDKNAQDTKSGAGQYFTPRPLIQAIVDVMRPEPDQTICDPACGTGGFLLAAHEYIQKHYELSPSQEQHLRFQAFRGWEIVPNTARLCAMNLLLHGIGGNDFCPVHVEDALRSEPKEQFNMVLTNPPFGKKSSVTFVSDSGEKDVESFSFARKDFWTKTSNKQLNFLQHIKSLLKPDGRAAVIVPDNVLFEGGAGETIRRKLLTECDVHTLLRLPDGIFYAHGVKANVLFFDNKPSTRMLWVYDLRINKHFTLKTYPMQKHDLDNFVACYNPDNRYERVPTWSEDNSNGRWRAYSFDELIHRDKISLDIFWLHDESLEGGVRLPSPDVLAAEIVEDLQAALDQFAIIADDLRK